MRKETRSMAWDADSEWAVNTILERTLIGVLIPMHSLNLIGNLMMTVNENAIW